MLEPQSSAKTGIQNLDKREAVPWSMVSLSVRLQRRSPHAIQMKSPSTLPGPATRTESWDAKTAACFPKQLAVIHAASHACNSRKFLRIELASDDGWHVCRLKSRRWSLVLQNSASKGKQRFPRGPWCGGGGCTLIPETSTSAQDIRGARHKQSATER